MFEDIPGIADLIRKAEIKAYKQGIADAKKAIDRFAAEKASDPSSAQAVHQESQEAPEDLGGTEAAQPKGEATSKRRAVPRGTTSRLIRRVLTSSPGRTPLEIMAYANTEDEREVRPQSLRNALRRGRDKGRYHEKDSRWYLVPRSEAAEKAKAPSATSEHRAPA